MISIIIPVYNEEATIRDLLESLPYNDGIEVVVADGGSQDRTLEFAKLYPARVVQSPKGRAIQMNKGAEASCGEVLLFLHADCSLSPGSLEAIQMAIKGGYGGGCLSQRIKSRRLIFRCIEASGNIRARLFKTFYGDQAIFARRDIFLKLGGFDDVGLFEDILFSKKLRREARVGVLSQKVLVSPRRWERCGIIRTTLLNWALTLGFLFDMPSDRLRGMYYDIR